MTQLGTTTFTHHRVEAIDELGIATSFIYDGSNVLLETDDAGVTQASYTIEPIGLSTFGAIVNEDGYGLITNTPGGGGLEAGQLGPSGSVIPPGVSSAVPGGM